MLKAIRLQGPDDPLFGEAWELYETSFPLCEQRTPEHQATAFQSPAYTFEIYLEDEKLIGLIGYWTIGDYLYIEHYAIHPRWRGAGYGSRILNALRASTDRLVILEIEEVVDELTRRRLHFYERLGFRFNAHRHPLPRYREGAEHREAFLHILTAPRLIDREEYERFNRDLQTIVMKRA